MQTECLNIYKKEIFKQVNEKRKIEIGRLNKKSVYRNIYMEDDKTEFKMGMAEGAKQNENASFSHQFEVDDSKIAQNLLQETF